MSDFKGRVVSHHKSFRKYIAIAADCFANMFVETRYFLLSDDNPMLQYNEIRGTELMPIRCYELRFACRTEFGI